jgi:hypothetical protein
MNPDPIAALRAVLAENARIPALEAEIAHLRGKRPNEPSEHLPCPFCGGKGFVDSRVAPSSMNAARCRATVACVKCSMIGPSAFGANHTESIANAWAAWDRRDGGGR